MVESYYYYAIPIPTYTVSPTSKIKLDVYRPCIYSIYIV